MPPRPQSTEASPRKIPPREIRVEAAKRQRRFLVLRVRVLAAKPGVKAPLHETGSELPPIEPCIAGAGLEAADVIRGEDDAGFDVLFFDPVEIQQRELDFFRVRVRQRRE
jgi:hypothetical protein